MKNPQEIEQLLVGRKSGSANDTRNAQLSASNWQTVAKINPLSQVVSADDNILGTESAAGSEASSTEFDEDKDFFQYVCH